MNEREKRLYIDMVRRLCLQTDCSALEAERALFLRENIFEFAKEWLLCGIDDCYPKWEAHRAKKGTK